MDKAFDNFQWKNFPSMDTPINATNLNKINDALDLIDDRVIALHGSVEDLTNTLDTAVDNISDIEDDISDINDNVDSISDSIGNAVETIGQTAIAPHTEDSFFYATDSKIYRALSDIAIGDTLTVGTNCVQTDIVSNLGGSGGSGSSGHVICDDTGTTYPQRSKLQIINATITDDSTNDATVVTVQSGGSSTILSQTLVAGSTSVTFTNIPTTGNYLVDFYTSDGVPHTDIDTSTPGQVTVLFDAQSDNITVFCEIKEIIQV